ncbi:pseudouridine synthase family protein [Mycoplasma aquilae ATCC BAA-1896]|uniref:pseudouridine synthase family protein n=1 Tax=Mycoplasma aquilae TaxID=1312741 RepID=UPI003A86438A
MLEIKATKNDAGRSVFKVISKYCSTLPLSRIEKIFRKKDIKINNDRKITKNQIINEGDLISIYGILEDSAEFKEAEVSTAKPNFKVLYEDENILIIDKPTGVEVHGEDNCLDNQVLTYLNFKPVDSFKPSHIGRLDKETSGIILYGKNYQTVSYFNDHSDNLIKKYTFWSNINLEKYTSINPLEITLYSAKDEPNKRMKVSPKKIQNGKITTTLFYMEDDKKVAQLVTGRKHQIRVTLKYLGYPIYGDRKYHGPNAKRLQLHSYSLKFQNITGDLKYLNNYEVFSLPNFKK